jgi:predicted amidohydrolase
VRNKALVFSGDGVLAAFYAKQRPFTLGGEREHYAAGDRGVVFSWAGTMVSPFVCYDLRFPELFRAVAAEHRPEVFVVIANWPEKRIRHWTRLLQARAIENQAFVIGVNRTGRDPNHVYCGRSAVVDPHGELIAEAGAGEAVVGCHLDLGGLREYRRGLPFLDDLDRR